MEDVTYCFLDTNALLHFQDFRHVDWPEKLGASSVVLVLAPVVRRELNMYKDDHTNEGKRSRARSVIAALRRLLVAGRPDTPAPVRANVEILAPTKEPRVDWKELGLDPDIGDDRLIASIVSFSESRPSAPILLVTDDFDLQIKAPGWGVVVREANSILDARALESRDAETIRRQRQELEQLKGRTPRLEFGLDEGGNAVADTAVELDPPPQRWLSDAQIAKIVASKRRELGKTVAAAPASVRREAIDDFRDEYEEYLTGLEEYAVKERARRWGRRCKLAFVLRNTGPVAATDVEIVLAFPPESFVVGLSDEESSVGFRDLRAPKEPEAEWLKPASSLRYAGIPLPRLPGLNPVRHPEPRGPLYDEDDRTRATYEHPKLRQAQSWQLERLAVYLPPSVRGGFNIGYTLQADHLSAPVAKELQVRGVGRPAPDSDRETGET